MESLLVLMAYGWIVAGLIWLADHIPAHKGDKERFFKKEGEGK